MGRATRRSWAFAALKDRGFGGWYDGLNVFGGRRRRGLFGILRFASIVAEITEDQKEISRAVNNRADAMKYGGYA